MNCLDVTPGKGPDRIGPRQGPESLHKIEFPLHSWAVTKLVRASRAQETIESVIFTASYKLPTAGELMYQQVERQAKAIQTH
jgi:hypothetical protein